MDYAEFRKKFGISEKQAETKPPVDSGIGRNADGNEKDTGDPVKVLDSLSGLSKEELLKFAKSKNIYNRALKNLEHNALAQQVLENVKAKLVEVALYTDEEVSGMSESELLALLSTIETIGR